MQVLVPPAINVHRGTVPHVDSYNRAPCGSRFPVLCAEMRTCVPSFVWSPTFSRIVVLTVLSMPHPPDIVLWGITRSGRAFRPSDWAERLAGLTAAFKLNERLGYSALVRPTLVAGVRALVVSGQLQQEEPRLYQFLVNFARDNELLTTESVAAITAPQSLTPPALPAMPTGGEPREPV